MFTLSVILAILLQIAIAFVVFYRRRGHHSSVLFVFLVIALAAWALFNYFAITVDQDQNTIYLIRAVLGLVVIQNTLFYFFSRTFPDISLKKLRHRNIYIVYYSVFVLLLTQSPLVFADVVIKHGTANPNPAPGMIFFVFHALLTIGWGISSLIRRYRSSSGQEKTQALSILFASAILWLIVPITNFVITLGVQSTVFIRFSHFMHCYLVRLLRMPL
jgi:hypothetical protein